MNILELINELQMAKSLWYEKVIRANKDRSMWGGSFSVEYSEDNGWNNWDVVITLE